MESPVNVFNNCRTDVIANSFEMHVVLLVERSVPKVLHSLDKRHYLSEDFFILLPCPTKLFELKHAKIIS